MKLALMFPATALLINIFACAPDGARNSISETASEGQEPLISEEVDATAAEEEEDSRLLVADFLESPFVSETVRREYAWCQQVVYNKFGTVKIPPPYDKYVNAWDFTKSTCDRCVKEAMPWGAEFDFYRFRSCVNKVLYSNHNNNVPQIGPAPHGPTPITNCPCSGSTSIPRNARSLGMTVIQAQNFCRCVDLYRNRCHRELVLCSGVPRSI